MKSKIKLLLFVFATLNMAFSQNLEDIRISKSRMELFQDEDKIISDWIKDNSQEKLSGNEVVDQIESTINSQLELSFSKDEIIEIEPNLFCAVKATYTKRISVDSNHLKVEFFEVNYFYKDNLLAKKALVYAESSPVYNTFERFEVVSKTFSNIVNDLSCTFDLVQTNGKLKVVGESERFEIKIFNTLSKEMSSAGTNNNVCEIDLSGFQKGIYFVVCEDVDKVKQCSFKIMNL